MWPDNGHQLMNWTLHGLKDHGEGLGYRLWLQENEARKWNGVDWGIGR